MSQDEKLSSILDRLQEAGVANSLHRFREDAITIQAASPGYRWEIEVMSEGDVEIEVFKSDGTVFDESKLKKLIDQYSDLQCVPVEAGSTTEGRLT